MLDQELLQKVLRQALSAGGDYADLFVEWKRPTYVVLDDRRIEKCVTGVELGVGLRLLSGGRTAFAFSNELGEKPLLELASGLGRAVSGGGAPAEDIDLVKRNPVFDFHVGVPPSGVPMGRKTDLLRKADRVARGVSGKVKQVSVVYRDSLQKVQIATSDGVFAEDERVHTTAMVNVVAQDGATIQTGYEALGGHAGFELFDRGALEAAALKAAERAVRMLTARRAPGGRMAVVISSEAGGTMIHEAIGHGLEADLAVRGLSRFSGMVGKQVASPLVSVIDDSTLPGKRGTFRFDDEGAPARRNLLVEAGVLKGYMYDRLVSMKEGVESTGNGRRDSYRHRPIPRMTNTFLAPGNSSPEDVLRATPSGLLVRKMGGGQVNTVTGDFVFDVMEGYVIRDGSSAEPVRGATITGNGPEVLRSIDLVASDLGFSIGTCGKDSQGVPISDAMPTVRIPEMVVGGAV